MIKVKAYRLLISLDFLLVLSYRLQLQLLSLWENESESSIVVNRLAYSPCFFVHLIIDQPYKVEDESQDKHGDGVTIKPGEGIETGEGHAEVEDVAGEVSKSEELI